MTRDEVVAVVPTLGAPTLASALAALHADRPGLTLRVVHQGEKGDVVERVTSLPALANARLEWIFASRPLGFAAAVNLGLDGQSAPWIAVVNDDAEVAAGWSETLIERLVREPGDGAAQGRNLAATSPLLDGEGIAWNRDWQAVQIGHGEPATARGAGDKGIREVFGVAATAAIYRRSALEALKRRDGAVFDPRLGSFYEDVDLAVRLRRDGWRGSCVRAATARHHGSLTAGRWPLRRWVWIHGNRWLVLARLLGVAVSAASPRALRRDLRDAAAAIARGDVRRALGVAGGFARAARRWRDFAHRGAPLVDPTSLAAFGAPMLPAISGSTAGSGT